MDMQTSITLDMKCDDCRSYLQASQTRNSCSYGSEVVFVQPCEICLKNSFDKGYEEGKEEAENHMQNVLQDSLLGSLPQL